MRDGARTKARIEAEALRLFATKGVDATSIRDIAGAVGVAEGALYRHFAGKESLSRAIFLDGYAELAARVTAAGGTGRPFPEVVEDVVSIFCSLFDENRPLFSFLLIAQHAHLGEVAPERERNVVEAVAAIFAAAMEKGELPCRDANEIAAMALGIVAQPAIFTLYGRLKGPLIARVPVLTGAILAAARASAKTPRSATGPAP
jgi:AcrR family transcriptional regulator